MEARHRHIRAFVLFTVVFMWATLIPHLVPSASAQADERLQQLSADQKPLAQRMLQFMSDMDKKYFTRVYALNGNSESESTFIKSACNVMSQK